MGRRTHDSSLLSIIAGESIPNFSGYSKRSYFLPFPAPDEADGSAII